MTNQEKAEKYDALVREGHSVQHQISKLKSENIGNNLQENENMLNDLKNKLIWLEQECTKLMY
jgi:hypothetical protein